MEIRRHNAKEKPRPKQHHPFSSFPFASFAKHLVALVALGFFLAACGTRSSDNADTSSTEHECVPGESQAVSQLSSTAREEVPSALVDRTDARLPTPLVEPIISGGPPPDGIPPIDNPRFEKATDVCGLSDTEPVLALTIDNESRAYPIQILTWHEIVNDTLSGIPVSLSYCPLCNSAVVFDRRLEERILDFGTSGSLFNSSLVMYDRQTESLWTHFNGQAVAGTLTGKTLTQFPTTMVGWATWRDAHPEGLVLSRDTGHERNYGRNPYPGYDNIDTEPFLFNGDTDDRLAAKERVVGITDGTGIALTLSRLTQDKVIQTNSTQGPLVFFHQEGLTSGLDADAIANGKELGATAVFVLQADQENRSFLPTDGGFLDESGTVWNILGEAISGPEKGAQLTAVPHVDTFWFAWAAFLPETSLMR